jgi:DNA invertase Pin-like site-specific DNA recombinase
MIRAIGIVRVSQRDEAALSPEVQRRAIVKLASEHGWSLRAGDILDENVDGNGRVRNVSGTWELKDRPKLHHAIEQVEAKRARVIVAERFDRMFRNELLRRMVVKRIQDAGGELWSAKAGEMTNQSAEGRLAHNVNGDVSEYTLETAKERSWDAVELVIEQGRFFQERVPPGLRRGSDDVLVPAGPKEVRIVQQAFERRAAGATYGQVREFLASRGIKRTHSGVRQMLASRLYVGEIHFGKHTPNLRAHEAIIDRDLFERVQKTVVSAGRKPKSTRLLARLGVLRCGSCGGRMSVSSQAAGYAFYRCANDECAAKLTIGAEIVEREVVQTIREHARGRRGHARAAQRANRAEQEAQAADKAYRRAQRILADSADEAEAVAILAEKRAAREAARERADRLAAVVDPTVTVDIDAVFDHGTVEERRHEIRTRIERVTVTPAAAGRRGAARVEIELVGE